MDLLLTRLLRFLARCRLLLQVRLQGFRRVPIPLRRRLHAEQNSFNRWVQDHYAGASWSTLVLHEPVVQPFLDLLNRPAGGEAYCGGVVFYNPNVQPTLRHFRGRRAIDRPLTSIASEGQIPLRLERRQFWCGPLAFHFGHQIADFGSRLLLASLDPRGGELLWCPWRSGEHWEELQPWQQFLLRYLNPGAKAHRICTTPVQVKALVVVPQQARMRAAPTAAHLEGLCWCERSLQPRSNEVVYVSRARFAACTNAASLLGAYAAEALLEKFLEERGVRVIHPESISLQQQLEIYLGSRVLILAEGSAQHGLELLGVHPHKKVLLLCRRPQREGMDLPLRARFPNIQFVEALKAQWRSADGETWNGLALLDWSVVVKAINPWLISPTQASTSLGISS